MKKEKSKIKLPSCWLALLRKEFEKDYMADLKINLLKYKSQGKTLYPPTSLIFHSFSLTLFEELKIVILGQDPYHGPRQAHGLSFSVPDNIVPPPSLQNIFKELQSDINIDVEKNNGNLERWAKQGVLLLNTTLTVEKGKPLSHRNLGWSFFTDKVIQIISEHKDNVVFFLWGSHAQSKLPLIDSTKHLIIKSAHPSPLSSHKGFLGSRPFSKANSFLKTKNLPTIDWK